MTIEDQDSIANRFKLDDATIDVAHWLPFAAKKAGSITKCDVDGYFVADEKPDGNLTSAFRGRVLNGRVVDTDGFTIFADNPKQSACNAVEIRKLIVWNHDDIPLNSDVVPQAIALARLQNELGLSD
jgi:hypothetical protein